VVLRNRLQASGTCSRYLLSSKVTSRGIIANGSMRLDRQKDGRLTTENYWSSGYAIEEGVAPPDVESFTNLPFRRIVETIEATGIEGKRVLEIGAGNSQLLCHLAGKFGRTTRFSGLDYSSRGCELLTKAAQRIGAEIDVIECDLFEAPQQLSAAFDLVYSVGVAEHFSSLSSVLVAKRRFLAPYGRLLTIIPNMAGIIGTLTKRYSPAVYAKHVAHDLASLRHGHLDAGLMIESSGYLCSTNFGVLSSCFISSSDKGWRTYLWLSRLSKLLWSLESKIGDLPRTAKFSPYIFVTASSGPVGG
jgi:SAM-dependent methyltransferase